MLAMIFDLLVSLAMPRMLVMLVMFVMLVMRQSNKFPKHKNITKF